MPNPPLATRLERGNCFNCDAYGGPEKFGATYCLRPQDSGKRISNMPEVGCYTWRLATPATPAAAPSPEPGSRPQNEQGR